MTPNLAGLDFIMECDGEVLGRLEVRRDGISALYFTNANGWEPIGRNVNLDAAARRIVRRALKDKRLVSE